MEMDPRELLAQVISCLNIGKVSRADAAIRWAVRSLQACISSGVKRTCGMGHHLRHDL